MVYNRPFRRESVDPSTLKNILLVESEPPIALAEAQAVRRLGYDVSVAHTGDEAVDLATRDSGIDLILMDIDLGTGVDRAEAAQRILSLRKVPIVFLTSQAEKDYAERAGGITCYGYVLKNSDDFVLRSSIETAFRLFDAHEKYTKREERLESAEILSGFGSWEFNLSTGRVFASKGARALYGLGGLDDWTIEKVKTIPLPEYRPALDAAMSALIQGKAPYDVEFEIRRPTDGKTVHIHSFARYDAEQNIVLGTIQDITERKLAERELIKSQNLLNDMGKTAKIGGWRVDLETDEIQWTEELYLIHEVPPSFKLTADSVIQFYTPESMERVKEARDKVTASGEPYDIEVEIITDKGNRRWVRNIGRPIYTDGKITSRSGVLQDITERKLADEKIKNLLTEKELLLRETHHRIKNNMSTIVSLLNLQAGSLNDSSAVSALQDAGGRVRGMMALYDKLYQTGDFQIMPVADYFSSLIDEVVENFPNRGLVRIEKKIDAFDLDVKKIQPLGIIINELFTNIMKYAFSEGAGRADSDFRIPILRHRNLYCRRQRRRNARNGQLREFSRFRPDACRCPDPADRGPNPDRKAGRNPDYPGVREVGGPSPVIAGPGLGGRAILSLVRASYFSRVYGQATIPPLHDLHVFKSVCRQNARRLVPAQRYLAEGDDLGILILRQFAEPASHRTDGDEMFTDSQSHLFPFVRTAAIDNKGLLALIELHFDFNRGKDRP